MYEGEEWEGYCHEHFFNETHGDEWCKAAEYGPFECPPGFGYEYCEYFMFRNCEGHETCFVDYLDENMDHKSGYCKDLKPADDSAECQVVCTEAFECPEDSSFEECQMKHCHDTCTGDFECYASWNNNGTEHQGKCADYHQAEQCAAEEPKPVQCEYKECPDS